MAKNNTLLDIVSKSDDAAKKSANVENVAFTKLDAEKVLLEAKSGVGVAESNLTEAIKDSVKSRDFAGIVEAEDALATAKQYEEAVQSTYDKYFKG